MKPTELLIFDDKPTENDELVYNPIRNVMCYWSIDCSQSSFDLQKDYRKELLMGNKIRGLCIWKKTGEWAWVEEDMESDEE